MRRPRRPRVGEVLRQRLPADVEQRQTRAAPPSGSAQPIARSSVGGGQNTLTRSRRSHSTRSGPPRVASSSTTTSVAPEAKASQNLLHRGIVGVRRTLADALPWLQPELGEVRRHEVGDPAVLDHHALRPARRAGRVDQVRERAGRRRRLARAARASRRRDGVGDVDRAAGPRTRSAARLAPAASVNSMAASESSRMARTRSSGWAASRHVYAAPVLSAANCAAYASGDVRGSRTATMRSVRSLPPTAGTCGARASASASSSRYVTR